jgi:hypothetical protein
VQSFCLLFPAQNQIANHEEPVLDVAVIVPAEAFQIFSCTRAGVKAMFLDAINFELSRFIRPLLVMVLDPCDWKAMSAGSTTSELKTMKYGETTVLRLG